MINIIIPIVEDVEKYVEFIKNSNSKNVKFFVGIKESLKEQFSLKIKNIEIHYFANKSGKEEIINSLHSCNMTRGKLMVVRRPLTNEEFLALSDCEENIAILSAHHNRFVKAFKNLVGKIVRRFFAFNYFEDISAICYDENMFEILSVCSNLSMATRINKYVGVEIEEIVTQEKPVKREYDHLKNLGVLLLGIFGFLGSLAGGICVCIFTPLRVLIVICVIAWLVVALVLLFVAIINFTRTIAVGNLRFGRAEERLKNK